MLQFRIVRYGVLINLYAEGSRIGEVVSMLEELPSVEEYKVGELGILYAPSDFGFGAANKWVTHFTHEEEAKDAPPQHL